ncbi:MAG: helix-turn-helix transcriptional regulator, partial [Alistipes sp.]|nr:helix-turn-helix transcriptional regulator [Alistipes sp.]
MATAKELNKVLLGQDFEADAPHSAESEAYMAAARSYAAMEGAVAVLSDMATDASNIFYGGFAERLGIGTLGTHERIRSIWESAILGSVHPDDLRNKYIQELRFYHFVKRLPAARRYDYYLAGKLRMKDGAGGYVQVLHRMFYKPDASGENIRFALCLYNPLTFEMPAGGLAVNSLTGETMELGRRDNAGI